MIDRINSSVAVSVDKATKQAADALERVTNRIAGEPDNVVDRSVSVRLTSQYNENYIKARNAQDSISYHQTRDSSLGSVSGMLMRLRNLAVQMGSPILNDSDKSLIQREADMIMNDIDSFSSTAKFNYHSAIGDVSTSSLGISGLDIRGDGSLNAIDKALERINTKRAETGASISALEGRIDNLASANLNLAEAVENRAGSLIERIIHLNDAVTRAMVSIKAADLVTDVNSEKIKSLLDI
ncbi:MAG: hypothetical protein C0602_01205 [Denitrovibrio sp.]|nr:MAG: hypothetical protein C0602_01205 [Denitrovibrio sp.]